jgi:hypothetical protein
MSKNTKVEETTKVEENKLWYNKIELLCDVYSGSTLQKAWDVLELSKEELEKYAESFYKKL